MRKYLTQTYHYIVHLAADKLDPLIRKRFYWPNTNQYITNFCTMCRVCQQCKSDNPTPKAPLVPMFIPDGPMQFIYIDTVSYKHM